MSGSSISGGGLDVRRRKLLFRSWHRGMREMDLIMGRLAYACLAQLPEADLAEYERLLLLADSDLLAFVTGQAAIPVETDCGVLRRLRAFYRGGGGLGGGRYVP